LNAAAEWGSAELCGDEPERARMALVSVNDGHTVNTPCDSAVFLSKCGLGDLESCPTAVSGNNSMNASIIPRLEKCPLVVAGRAPVDVVITYDGIAAAQQAIDAMAALKPRRPASAVVVRVSTWWFRFLEDAEQMEKATAAAIEADVLLVAANMGVDLPCNVEGWLQESLSKNRKPGVAVVALLGEANHRDRPDSPRFLVVQRIAREAGALFFAPSPTTDAVVDRMERRNRGRRSHSWLPAAPFEGSSDLIGC